MTNENYLIVSYFIVFIISLSLGIFTYKCLKSAFEKICKEPKLSKILNRMFPFGIIFPAIIGYMSVSFYSCDKDNYQKVVEKKSYLIGKNLEQLSATLNYLVCALVIWSVIILIYIRYQKKANNQN